MRNLKSVKRLLPTLLLLLLAFLVTGCSASKKIAKAFVLSETEFTMLAGTTKTLSLDNPKNVDVGEYTLAWMAEDSAVATVEDDGTVTAVAPGSTKITVAVRAEKAEVYFHCTVTVTENNTPLSSLSFNSTVYSVGEGQTLDLKKEILYKPSYAAKVPLEWTSSNPDIATVDDGVISPVSQGISTVTVATEDGKISATCTVRVSEISIAPEGVSFEETEITASVGREIELTPIITPENATGYTILWSSSDEEVAVVLGGKVTPLREGIATITATLSVGDGTLFAECNVTVEATEDVSVPATGVSLSPDIMTILDNEDGPFKLKMAVTPANSTEKPYWSSSNPNVLKINSETGEFTVADTVKEAVSVVVTCTVGEASDTSVVYVNSRKPKLEIGIVEDAVLYDTAPLNTMVLVAAYVNSNVLPEVIWESSDSEIASVDSVGNVVGRRRGTCTVTATVKDDASISAQYEVTVKEADFVTVAVGDSVKIPSRLILKDDVSWSAPSMYLQLNTATMTVTGVKKTLENEFTTISGYSASDGKQYVIKVYVTN